MLLRRVTVSTIKGVAFSKEVSFIPFRSLYGAQRGAVKSPEAIDSRSELKATRTVSESWPQQIWRD